MSHNYLRGNRKNNNQNAVREERKEKLILVSSLTLSSSWSADTPTSSCVVASMDDDCHVTGIREEVIHLTHFDLDGQVVVQTVNGSLLEYWV
ncbi:hypothetical protein pdam_00013153 [Pocillopora damicornis]|uniref:Uncharacterized protein n=1 Tax=Pocillopora damicornis TaxID=46731 RepID=A0A3M6UK40_POCDA|nr:hypothetical protein pdam_00013153 [Pocillopora damicornis]